MPTKYEQRLGRIIFCIHEIDVQTVARRRIGRRLTEEELYQVEKGLQWGLTTGIDSIYKAAIEQATGL